MLPIQSKEDPIDMKKDPRGCPVNSRSSQAISHMEKALWRMISYYGDPIGDLDAAIEEDPNWALPLITKANCLLLTTEYKYRAIALSLLEEARPLLLKSRCNREQMHFYASLACAEGEWEKACERWEQILVEYPRDVSALLAAHLIDFCRGDSTQLQRRVARVLPAWSSSDPLHSYVLGLHAFGLEECNRYSEAFETGQMALEANINDPWAIHAITHVHEMRGEHELGAKWLSSLTNVWAPENGLAAHNWWHLALFHLENGEVDQALGLYDQHISEAPVLALQHIDMAAFLWRLKLLDVELGDRWQSTAAFWPVDEAESGYYCFNDVHAVLAHIGAGNLEPAMRLLASVEKRGAENSTLGHMAKVAGAPLIRGLLAYAESDFARATDELLVARSKAVFFGGSHAQRDIVYLTLVDASIRAGRRSLAKHLLNERMPHKQGTVLTDLWLKRAA
ncbi:MAG TPA: tetratricopeptide repeat protein [Pseudoxanthomonas sp.]